MALRANIKIKLFFAISRTGVEGVAAAADDFDFPVVRVNFCLHIYIRGNGSKANNGNINMLSDQCLNVAA